MNAVVEKKIVSISSKRQITIPQKFFQQLNFKNEAECIMRGSEIIIKPVSQYDLDEYSDLILSDLVSEGYAGQELIHEFKNRKAQMKAAVGSIIDEADAVAEGRAESSTFDEIFVEK